MQAMIDDALDLARLRVRPLEAYQYPLWQTALLITLLGVIAAAAGDGWIQGDWSTRVGFFVAVSWLETGLLAQARARGLHTVDGMEMLIGQAAEAFSLFFGQAPPRDPASDAGLRAVLA